MDLLDRQTRRDDSPPHTILYNSLYLPDRVTALPSSPRRGDVVRYVADATDDIIWWLYYDADSTSTYKWKPLDVVPLYDYIATQQSTTSSSPTDLGTVGPSLTAPLAGDYRLHFGASIQNQSAATNTAVAMAPSINGGTPVEADGLSVFVSTNTPHVQADCSTVREYTGWTAGTTVVMKYWRSNGSSSAGYYRGRFASLTPIRVG